MDCNLEFRSGINPILLGFLLVRVFSHINRSELGHGPLSLSLLSLDPILGPLPHSLQLATKLSHALALTQREQGLLSQLPFGFLL